MDRAEKQTEVELLSECFRTAELALCADYRGLTVEKVTNLRRALRQSGATSRVVKNTLAKLSLEKAYQDADAAEVKKFIDLLKGPNFLIFVKKDAVVSAKVAAKFEKDLEHLAIKGGWFAGKFLDKSGVVEFSNMASKEETLAKLLCLLSTPATQLVRVIQAPAQQLVRVLEAYRAKLEKGAA
jgi:large subunit ribosomal protein L10